MEKILGLENFVCFKDSIPLQIKNKSFIVISLKSWSEMRQNVVKFVTFTAEIEEGALL